MQSISDIATSISDFVPVAQEFPLLCFFCIGFIFFRSDAVRKCFRESNFCKRFRPTTRLRGLHPVSRLRDDFTQRRYEKVLEGWATLETYTAEGLSLVVTALLALGRPEDVGVFVAKTAANLPHLRPGLHQVLVAVATPACEVRRQHVSLALRDVFEQARQFLDVKALQQLLLSFASHNDERRVTVLLSMLAEQKCPSSTDFLGNIVRGFLSCKNLDAALGFLQHVLAAPGASTPTELILEVVRTSVEAAINDDSTASGVRPRAWDALDALKGVEITQEAAALFLEWSARQTPVDVAMATRIEGILRQAGPLPMGAHDALVRVHASSAGDQAKAVACFDELVGVSADANQPSEASLVGMISSCVEARNGPLAEHILRWACAQHRCTLPIFSATIKVLAAAKQSARVCAIYESVVKDQNLALDEALRTQIINCAAQAGRLELARSLFGHAQQPNVQNYISLMRAAGQEGNVEQALVLLRELQNAGEVDVVTYNCALDVCVSCGKEDLAKRVLKDMKAAGKVDVVSYNIMLKLSMNDRAAPLATEAVLREMGQRGLKPNTATYNSLLGGMLAAGDFSKAWRTVDQMEMSGQGPDAYTLSILFKGYKHERRTMDADSLDRAMLLVKKHSVRVDEVLVNVALEACIALRDVNRLRRAMATFASRGFVLSKESSMHTYGVFIKAHGLSQNLQEARRLWRELTVERGVEANEQLYGQMLDVLVSGDRMEDALALFNEMKEVHRKTLDSQGFAVAYAMIIRGFAQRKNCAQALQCYEEMKSNGTKASQVVLNTLIDACSRVGDMVAASKLFNDMLETDCVPDVITYSTLIKGHCVSNNLEQAMQLFTTMGKKGIRPDAIVFNSLLDGCAKRQMPSLCEQVIRDMEKAGVVPSNHSASILIKLYGRCKNLDAAFRVINDMPLKYGFKPNNPVYTCLMATCISNGRLDRAMELLVRMRKEGVYPDEKTYSTLLRGTLKAASVDQCVVCLTDALDHHAGGRNAGARCLLDEDLVKSAMILIRRKNLWDVHGQGLYERLRSAGVSVRCPGEGGKPRNDGQGVKSAPSRNTGTRQDADARPQQQRRGPAPVIGVQHLL